MTVFKFMVIWCSLGIICFAIMAYIVYKEEIGETRDSLPPEPRNTVSEDSQKHDVLPVPTNGNSG